MPRLARFLLAAGLAAAAPPAARADILVTDFDGVFVNPVGGENAGVGTHSFITGRPFSATDTGNFVEFFPVRAVLFPGVGLVLPTGSTSLGTLRFYNGVTTPGTSASSVELAVTGTATFLDLDPAIERPVIAFKRIAFTITPNTTGNAKLDGDIWTFENGKQLHIPEGSLGEVSVGGRLIPRQIASPPKYFDVEFTDFTPLSGDIEVTDTPAAVPGPPAAVLAVLGVLIPVGFRRARRLR